MWNKELVEDGAKGFRLFEISMDEIGRISAGGLVVERDVLNAYKGEVVLCCGGETRFIAQLTFIVGLKDINGSNSYTFEDIRPCIELPCPELLDGVSEVWYYSPAECLIAYPTEYKRDYRREARIAKWKMRWLCLAWFACWFVGGVIAGVLFGLLSVFSPFLVGLLVFVFVVIVSYRGYRVIK